MLLCALLASLDPGRCGQVWCHLSLKHMRADTHIWVIGKALLFRTKGGQVYVSLWPQHAVLFCLRSGSCGSVVCHVGEIIIRLYFLGHDISEHLWWCWVYSRPTLLIEGLWWSLKSNEATVCMCWIHEYGKGSREGSALPMGYTVHSHWAYWTPCMIVYEGYTQIYNWSVLCDPCFTSVMLIKEKA